MIELLITERRQFEDELIEKIREMLETDEERQELRSLW
jgi:hypothetical protein